MKMQWSLSSLGALGEQYFQGNTRYKNVVVKARDILEC